MFSGPSSTALRCRVCGTQTSLHTPRSMLASKVTGAPGRRGVMVSGRITSRAYPMELTPPWSKTLGAGHVICTSRRLFEPDQSNSGGMPASPGLRQ